MQLKGIIDEDFVNYRKPSMYLIFPSCSFKCDHENGARLCQNLPLNEAPNIEIDKNELIQRYIHNLITEAIVCAGLEPFDSELDLLPFIDSLRRQYHCLDDVVIYTGYTEEELESGKWGHGAPDSQKTYWNTLKTYENIIVKFGRFRPNNQLHFDKVLGINLISQNQYAKQYNYKESL